MNKGSLAELAIAPGCNPVVPFEVPGSNPGRSTKMIIYEQYEYIQYSIGNRKW